MIMKGTKTRSTTKNTKDTKKAFLEHKDQDNILRALK